MRSWPLICLLSIFNDLSDVTWLSLKSQDLKTVKHLKTMLEVINLRTQEHLSIPNTCGMPHLSKPKRNQALGLQMWLLHLLDRYRSCIRMAQETPGRDRPKISIRNVSRLAGTKVCKDCLDADHGATWCQWAEQAHWYLTNVSGEMSCLVLSIGSPCGWHTVYK